MASKRKPRPKRRESALQRKAVRLFHAAGCVVINFNPLGLDEYPDLLVLAPKGKCAFVEMKDPRGVVRIGQGKVMGALAYLGYYTAVVRSLAEAVENVLAPLGVKPQPGASK